MGDACDADGDGDGVSTPATTARTSPIPIRLDTDGDGVGDACDADDDSDGMDDAGDNCPLDPNPDQEDADGDGMGDACDADNADARQRRRAGQCRSAACRRASGQVVDAEGCAIAQICPCEGQWQNRLAYVACVARTANDFREDGLISVRELAQDRARGGQVPLRGEVRELAGPD